MSGNPITRAASAVAARVTGRAARATAYINSRKEDVSLKNLEATRVFVSAIFRDLSDARSSSPWIEPLLFTPIIPTTITRMKANEVGLRMAEDPDAPTNTGDGYTIYPGRLVDVISGNRVVHVEGLIGVGSDWGSYDLIDELNVLCFPDDLIPTTQPNWIEPTDPRHVNLFANVAKHLTEVGRGSSPTSPERAAAQAALKAIELGRDWYLSIFQELAKQATNEGKPVPFGPTESMWLAHLSMEWPAWAVRYDATAGTEGPSKTEQAIERMAEFMAQQAANQAAQAPSVPVGKLQTVLDRLAAIEAENAELKAMLAAPAVEATSTTPPPDPETPAPAVNRRR